MELYNESCFDAFKKIKSNTVDLVVVDLPYGQTGCEWDCLIDLNQMWIDLKRICTRKCLYVFFCTTKFGVSLINSNPKWFKYDLVWEKSKKVGFLSANKMPLRKHEMIYVFGNTNSNDLNNERNTELREYSKSIYNRIGKGKKEIYKDMGNTGLDHFFRFNSTQFSLPTKKNYDKLITYYKLEDTEDFDNLKDKWERADKSKYIGTYNPQKIPGKPYTVKRNGVIEIYNSKLCDTTINETGDRYPSSILKFNNPFKSAHRTQKPVDLCEWLIKSYSNKGDTVLDFTMGSGTTGVACKNTGRKFIGVEMDRDIFKIAKNRINLIWEEDVDKNEYY